MSRPLEIDQDVLDERGPGIHCVESHVSKLIFRDGLVHKLKKPVHFRFIDLSTPAKRELNCRREVDLNRRFSPDVYIGVEDILRNGRVVDHAVLMHEMPDERRLATMIRRGEDVSRWLDTIAQLIATCHRGAPRSTEISDVATATALHELWEDSLIEIDGLALTAPDRETCVDIRRLAHRFLDGRGPLLTARIAGGHIVDGHGDLLADDIFCLDDGPRILDCLEFDDRLRWGDVLNDVSFLAMDLERLGRRDLATVFMAAYRRHSGESHPATLEDHYVAYRALVRAKVALLRGMDDGRDAAHAYLGQAHSHLHAGRVRLVVIGGLPGTGKTTLARALSEKLGWPALHSDEIRKEHVGLDPLDHVPSSFGTGLYAPAFIDQTYATMCARARKLLGMGQSVILDASFSNDQHRRLTAAVSVSTFADLRELRCLLPTGEAARRLEARRLYDADASDADPEIAAKMAEHFDRWPDALNIGMVPPLAEVLPAVIDHILAS